MSIAGRGMTIAVVGLVVVVSPVTAQDGPGLLERLGALFGGAIEVEEEVAAPVAMGFVAPNQAAPAEIAARQKRLDTWCLALEESLVQSVSLTADQRVELGRLLTQETALNMQRWKKQQQRNQNIAIPATTVILFAGKAGPTSRLLRAVSKASSTLFTEQQQELYAENKTNRNQRIADWFARRATVVIDNELFLSDEQRTVCYEHIRMQHMYRSNGLYAFHEQRYYLPYESPEKLTPWNTEFQLTRIQQRRWKDVIADNNGRNNHVMVFVGAGQKNENDKQLEATYQQARKRFLNVAAVRAEHLSSSLELPQQQARYLEVAGKGATIQCLNSWKTQTQKQIKQWADNPQFVGRRQQIGLGGPDIRSFGRNKLWKSAVKKVCSTTESDVHQQRSERALEGAVAFVMATLDRELLLSDAQVKDLSQLVEESEPHQVASHQYYMLELAMIARTMVHINTEQLGNVLNEFQMECWKQIKAPFRFQGKERAQITTQHGDMNLTLTPSN